MTRDPTVGGLGDSPRGPVIVRGLAHAALWLGAYVASYNAVKQIVRDTTRRQFPPELKAAIQEAMPWTLALGALGAFALAAAATRRRRVSIAIGWLGAGTALAALSGPGAVAVGDSAVLMYLLFAAALAAAGRALRHWRGTALHAARRARSTGLVAACTVVVVGCALCAGQLSRQGRSTLFDNGRFEASKTRQELGGVGAVAFYVTRTPLARGHLDLSRWHGYQEVVLREAVDPRRIAFRCRVSADSYLVFQLARGDGEYLACRLSRHSRFPSAWLRSGVDGGFLDRRPIDFTPPAAWCRVELDCDTRELTVDGRPVATCPWPAAAGRIGFRGGKFGVLVDDLEIRTRDGGSVTEDFGLPAFGFGAAAWTCVVLVALGSLTALAFRRRSAGRPLLFGPLAVGVPVLAGFVLFTLLDYWVLAGANPLWVDYRGFRTTIETRAEVEERLAVELQAIGDRPRIVFLGSSQTWGAGATTADHTWVRHFERLLRQRRSALASGGPPWHCINGGISGAVSGEILAVYRAGWCDPAPRLAVVVLGNNDVDGDAFRSNLTQLVELDRALGTRTVLVLEPNSIEDQAQVLAQNHRIMREVGAATETPVIDLPAEIAECEDMGFLWCDHVHLSSFGQRLYADRLFEQITALGLLDDP